MKKLGEGFVDNYDWNLYPEAEKFLSDLVDEFLEGNKFAKSLAGRMEKETSTEIFDWIDHIVIPTSKIDANKLRKYGFEESDLKAESSVKVFKNKGSILFPILLKDEGKEFELVLKPEILDDCVRKLGKEGKIEGEKYAPYRRAVIKSQGDYVLSAVERRGSNDFVLKDSSDVEHYRKYFKKFSERKRNFSDEAKGFEYTKKLVLDALGRLKKERVADAFFRNERSYWQKRNKSGRIQQKRQNILGLGWGNHDHHTYRSSRENFSKLIELFELMGYECRERFYAGEKAGWGAQIVENPKCDIVIFSDVDITLEEKDKDFAHKGLKAQKNLGTVGLWVALHGESILQAGMHHLEARFNFDRLRKDLEKKGVRTMNPFSDFDFLKQAFTEGERWKVEKKRLDKLLKTGAINKEQYIKFLRNGAIGSHMENLQRRQGYKGFNQDSVTAIIKETNPLRQINRKRAKLA
jgi:hypothetical protein